MFVIINTAATTVLKIMYPMQYKTEVLTASNKYNLDPALVFAIIKTESNFDPNAISAKQAMGLMQITKDTLYFIVSKSNLGEHPVSDLFDPKFNIESGCFFINYLIDDFNNLNTALAAYNAGRGNVKKWLSDSQYSKEGITLFKIPFEETSNYVKKINTAYTIYKNLYFKK
jgi:soluble lytic murein transglycosylase